MLQLLWKKKINKSWDPTFFTTNIAYHDWCIIKVVSMAGTQVKVMLLQSNVTSAVMNNVVSQMLLKENNNSTE